MAISSNIIILSFYYITELFLSSLKEFPKDTPKLILYLGRKQGLHFSVLVIFYHYCLSGVFFYIKMVHLLKINQYYLYCFQLSQQICIVNIKERIMSKPQLHD